MISQCDGVDTAGTILVGRCGAADGADAYVRGVRCACYLARLVIVVGEGGTALTACDSATCLDTWDGCIRGNVVGDGGVRAG